MKRERPISSDMVWLIAVLSLVLPWLAGGLAIAGVVMVRGGNGDGWWLVVAGVLLFVLDIMTDLWLAHPSVSASEQPDLNRRGQQYVGRVVVLEEAIEGGRGKVRISDTLWLVTGPDLPRGTGVRVVGSKGTVLEVAPADHC